MKIVLRIFALLYFSLCSKYTFGQNTVFGMPKGSHTVTQNGAFIYSLPIMAPPGSGGMNPSVGLMYNSQGGLGTCGNGWSITGLSAITRVAKTHAQDELNSNGKLLGQKLNFDINDRFALDGERLNLSPDMYDSLNDQETLKYGKKGTTYYTESVNFSKTKIEDTAYGAPKYFTTRTKDGLIYEYGNTADSKIEAPGSNIPMIWLVNRIRDVKGNYINFKYAENNVTGEYYILEIEYTGNTILGKLPHSKIVFTYGNLQKPKVKFSNGKQTTQSVYLASIQTKYKNSQLRKYELVYEQNFQYQDHERMIKIIEYGLNNKKLSHSLNFKYAADNPEFHSSPLFNNHPIVDSLVNPTGNNYFIDGDWNGDGLQDIAVINRPDGANKFFINDGFGYFSNYINNFLPKDSLVNKMLLSTDFNADNRTDFLIYDTITGKNRFYLTNIDSINNISALVQTNTLSTKLFDDPGIQIQPDDWNNDGLTDLIFYKRKGFFNVTGNEQVKDYWAKNTGIFNDPLNAAQNAPRVGRLAFSITPNVSNTTNPNSTKWHVPLASSDTANAIFLDFNNDGLTDVFTFNDSTGVNKLYPRNNQYIDNASNQRLYSADFYSNLYTQPFPSNIFQKHSGLVTSWNDFNSDGNIDLIVLDSVLNKIKIYLNKGDFTFSLDSMTIKKNEDINSIYTKPLDTILHYPYIVKFEDFDFDGYTDLCYLNPNDLQSVAYIINGQSISLTIPRPDRVLFNDGKGAFNTRWNQIAQGQVHPVSWYTGTSYIANGNFVKNNCQNYIEIKQGGANFLYSRLHNETAYTSTNYSNNPKSNYLMAVFLGDNSNPSLEYPICAIEYKSILDTSICKRISKYTTYPATEFVGNIIVASKVMSGVSDSSKISIQNQGDNPFTLATTSRYKFESPIADMLGRGFRGFTVMHTFADSAKYGQSTYYLRDSQSFRYAGDQVIKQEQRYPNGNLSSQTIFDLKFKKFGKNYWSYTEKNTSIGYELNGTISGTSINTQYYDNFGNLTLGIIQHDIGVVDTTICNYKNDTAKWFLGRLMNSTLKRASPGVPSATRTCAFTYDLNTGMLLEERSDTTMVANQIITKKYKYDLWGNSIKNETYAWDGTSFESRTNWTIYDTLGRFPIKQTGPYGHIVERVHNPINGMVLQTKDPNGLITTHQYDDLGRIKKTILPDGTWSERSYKAFYPQNLGNSSQLYHFWYWYYSSQFLVEIKDTSSNGSAAYAYTDFDDKTVHTIMYGFDGKPIHKSNVFDYFTGLIRKSTNSYFDGDSALNTLNQYDYAGRVLSVTRSDGFQYTGNYNNLVTISSTPLSQTETQTKNQKQQIVSIKDVYNNLLEFEYDVQGNITKVKQPGNINLLTEYDIKGRKTKMIDPDMGQYQYEYNGFGELIKQIYPDGTILTMEYDSLGRIRRSVQPEGITNYTYDVGYKAIGHLVKVTGYNGVEYSYEYDLYSRPKKDIKKIENVLYTTQVDYDAQSRPSKITYPGGLAVKNIYNAYGYLKEVRRFSDNYLYWKATKKDNELLETESEYGNGVVTKKFYNPHNKWMDSCTATKNGTYLQKWAYTFNPVGNITSRSNVLINKTEQFTYDSLNRLTKSKIIGGDSVYQIYNAIGNITFKSDIGTYLYGTNTNGPHRLESVVPLNNGICLPSFQVNYEYYSFNKIKKLSNDSSYVEVVYGPDGTKVLQKQYLNNVLIKTRIYIAGIYEKEITPGYTKETNYIRDDNDVIATQNSTNGVSGIHYWHKDHLGSLVAISDSTGAIIEQLSYDPWGRRRNALTWSQMNVDTSNTLNIHGFGAHEHLDLFALIDMGGRVYDPYLGRFIQPDPYIQDITNLQNYNRYTYVYNNPLSYTDPSGYFSLGKFLKKAIKVITAPIRAVAKATYNLHKKAFDLYKAGVQEAAKWVKENYKTLIVVAVAIGVGALTAGIGTGFLATMASGAISGFASSTVSTLLNGGNLKSALTAGLKGAAIGALSAGLSFGVGDAAQALGTYGNNVTLAGAAVKVVGHGLVQGGISKLQGGEFSSGFWSGAVSAGWGIGSSNINNNAAQLVGGSIIGGCTSSISGGSFANGAITSAFVLMYNCQRHADGGIGSDEKSKWDPMNCSEDGMSDFLDITGNAGDGLDGLSEIVGSSAGHLGDLAKAGGMVLGGIGDGIGAIHEFNSGYYGCGIIKTAETIIGFTPIGLHYAGAKVVASFIVKLGPPQTNYKIERGPKW